MLLKKISLSLCVVFVSFSLVALEHSIIPTMEKYECTESLSKEKYTLNQYKRIADALNKKNERIRIVTYNVLCSLYDSQVKDSSNLWPERLPRVIEIIHAMNPDILGIQELSEKQRDDLAPTMDQNYHFVSIPTSHGQYDGIYYKKERFEKISSTLLYMTAQKELPSTSTMTTVHLKDLKTGKTFSVCNTHLAYSNIKMRSFQVRFLTRRLKQLASTMPVVFMGDLNSFPNRPDLNLPFYDGDDMNRHFEAASLKDAKAVSLLGHVGPYSTFTSDPNGDGTAFRGTGRPGVFLDHIYVSNKIKVLLHAVEPATSNGHFPSDHMPVLIDCILK